MDLPSGRAEPFKMDWGDEYSMYLHGFLPDGRILAASCTNCVGAWGPPEPLPRITEYVVLSPDGTLDGVLFTSERTTANWPFSHPDEVLELFSIRPQAAPDQPNPIRQNLGFWTPIVASVRTRGEADQASERLRQLSLPARIIWSSDYGSLRPGYWVVHSTRFPTAEEAERAAARLRALGFRDAYARKVQR